MMEPRQLIAMCQSELINNYKWNISCERFYILDINSSSYFKNNLIVCTAGWFNVSVLAEDTFNLDAVSPRCL